MIDLKLRRLPHGDGLPLPAYKTNGAAGLDLCAAISEDLILWVDTIEIIPTGFTIEIPPGYEGQVRPRSSLASKGVTVANSPGTIDCDYRGELLVIVANWGLEPRTIRRGDRIAQLVVAPVTRATVSEVETLTETVRGEGGFGSTGVSG